MSLSVIEKFDSRELTEGVDHATMTLKYVVFTSHDEAAVRDAVLDAIPEIYGNLQLEELTITPLGNGIWDVTASYNSEVPHESQYTFETGGGTTHITHSLETVGAYGVNPPNFQGAIGVTADGIEGVDITTPIYMFSETHRIPDSLVTGAYRAALFHLTGRTNAAPFKGFAPGEVLFLGASGTKQGRDHWEITYQFSASPNATGQAVGPIGGIAKRGWDYLWVWSVETVDQAALVPQPAAVYVERLYFEGDFAVLRIGV